MKNLANESKNQVTNNRLVKRNILTIKKMVLITIALWSSYISSQDVDTIPENSLYYFYEYQSTEKEEFVGIKYPEETKYNYNIIRNHDETSKICYEKKK